MPFVPADHIEQLHTEVRRLLAAALASDERHASEMTRRDELHVEELERRDDLHLQETSGRDALHVDELRSRVDFHAHELELIRAALETRDVIGQAKGIIMASLGCSAEEAFVLLTKQSHAENRKLAEIAAEIAQRAVRRDPRAGDA